MHAWEDGVAMCASARGAPGPGRGQTFCRRVCRGVSRCSRARVSQRTLHIFHFNDVYKCVRRRPLFVFGNETAAAAVMCVYVYVCVCVCVRWVRWFVCVSAWVCYFVFVGGSNDASRLQL
jgi:hypothetical protein